MRRVRVGVLFAVAVLGIHAAAFPQPGVPVSHIQKNRRPPAEPGDPPVRATVGPFEDGQGPKILTLYVVTRGDGTTRANVYVTPSRPNDQQATYVVRVLNPDEDIVYWQAYSREGSPEALPMIFTEDSGVPSARADSDDGFGDTLQLTTAGVYQIQVFSSSYTEVKLDLWRDGGYGVAMQPGTYHPWVDQPETLWLQAGSHPTASLYLDFTVSAMQGADPVEDAMRIYSGETEIFRAVGFESSPGTFKGQVQLDEAEILPAAPPETWRVELPRPDYRFTVTGFPVILCETEAAARTIGNSAGQVPDDPEFAYRGALVDHAFQVDIADLMPELLGARSGDAQQLFAIGADRPWDGGANVDCYDPQQADPQDPDPLSDVFRNYDLVNQSGALVAARWALGAEDADWPGRPNQSLVSSAHGDWLGSVGLHHFEVQKCPSGRDRECTAGGFCVSGECSTAFDENADRWDVLRHVSFGGDTHSPTWGFTALRGGNTLNYSELPSHLALAANEDNPCNAYVGEREVLYRRAAGMVLFDLMSLLEGYAYPDIANGTYSGHAAFRVRSHFGAFEKILPDLEGLMTEKACSNGSRVLRRCVNDAWTYGMRALFDRYWVSRMETARNQSAHFPAAFASFVRGIDDGDHDTILTTYRDMAFEFADRFRKSADAAGWFGENRGPSPSYTGMTHWFMGMALQDLDAINDDLATTYTLGRAAAFRQALRDSYYFHNHFVAREPVGGRAMAAHNFSHRIPAGLDYEQFGGAKGIVEDLEGIAVWSDMLYGAETVDTYQATLESHAQANDAFTANPFQIGYWSPWAEHFDANARPADPKFPHESMSIGSLRKFPEDDPQVFAVRRGDYYASLYVGSPSYIYYTDGYVDELRARPYAYNDGSVDHEEDSPLGHNLRHGSWGKAMVGGLSLIWSENFGTSLYATSWSPLTHHGMVLENVGNPAGDRFWEDYQVDLDVEDNTGQSLGGPQIVDVGGELEAGYSAPGTDGYQRRYEFLDDRIRVRVSVDTTALWDGVSLDRAWENIPFATTTTPPGCPTSGSYACGPWVKARGANVVATTGSCPVLSEGEHTLDEFAVVDSERNGVRVVITRRPIGADPTIHVRPYGLRFKSYNSPQTQVGRVEIPFDETADGAQQVLEYEIYPVSPLTCLVP